MLPIKPDSHHYQSAPSGPNRSSGDAEFDRIIESPSRAGLLTPETSPSAIITTTTTTESSLTPHYHHNLGPIPANRAALLRELADQQRRSDQMHRRRELVYRVGIAITLVLVTILVSLAMWMAFVAGMRLSMAAVSRASKSMDQRHPINQYHSIDRHSHKHHFQPTVATTGKKSNPTSIPTLLVLKPLDTKNISAAPMTMSDFSSPTTMMSRKKPHKRAPKAKI